MLPTEMADIRALSTDNSVVALRAGEASIADFSLLSNALTQP